MSDLLFDLFSPQRRSAIVDVGASPIDGAPPYQDMLRKDICTVVGFEPQAELLERLTRRRKPNEIYLPYVIGDGERATLQICRASGLSSVLKPDPSRMQLFEGLDKRGIVERTIACETKRLDDVEEIGPMDLLKLDMQGGELAALQSAKRKLSRAVAVQTEVSFFGLYVGQPTFGDVDCELRSQGFELHSMVELNRWPLRPVGRIRASRQVPGQVVDADALYLRSLARHCELEAEQLKHLALISYHCYRAVDLTLWCAQLLQRRNDLCNDSEERIVRVLASSVV